MAQHHVADEVDRLITRAHSLSFDLREPARTHAEVDRRMTEGRTIAREFDSLFRARSSA